MSRRKAVSLAVSVGELDGHAEAAKTVAKAPATTRGKAKLWNQFARWCQLHRLESSPASSVTVCLYFLAHEGRWGEGTLQEVLRCIREVHGEVHWPDPTASLRVKQLIETLRVLHSQAPQGADAISDAGLRQLLQCAKNSRSTEWVRRRNVAMLTVQFGGAMRSDDLAPMLETEVSKTPAGLLYRPHKRKTLAKPIPLFRRPDAPDLCPVQAYEDWLSYAESHDTERGATADRAAVWTRMGGGPAIQPETWQFAVSNLRHAAELLARVTSHSARVSFITNRSDAGWPEPKVRQVSGHLTRTMTTHYIRHVDPLDGAGHVIGSERGTDGSADSGQRRSG